MSIEKSLSRKHRDFFTDVWDVVRQIPEGRVTTYGAIARYLGSGISARMVGWALNASHAFGSVPAQRVVNRQGRLTGKMHFGNPERMQQLLNKEGINIEEDTVGDFEKLFWDPGSELAL